MRMPSIAKQLRNAAKLIETGQERHSCIAAQRGDGRARTDQYREAREFYNETMRKNNKDYLTVRDFEGNGSYAFMADVPKRVQNHRVLALCFAAAIADAGGLK